MAKRFRLLEGTHQQFGRSFKKGDVIETDMDLVQMFGPSRFVQEFDAVATPVRTKKSRVEEVEAEDPEDTDLPDAADDADESEADENEEVQDDDAGKSEAETGDKSYGEDVSAEFLMAEGKGVTVFLAEDGEYTLTKGEEVLHTAKSKTAVKNFLKHME